VGKKSSIPAANRVDSFARFEKNIELSQEICYSIHGFIRLFCFIVMEEAIMDQRTGFRKFRGWFNAGFVLVLVFSSLAFSLPRQPSTLQPYIIQGYSVDQVAGLVESYGGVVTSRLHVIQGVGAQLTSQAALALSRLPEIRGVTLNERVEASCEGGYPATDYPDVTGADEVWTQGVDGDGVTVAVVDTGIGKHPGVKHQVVGWVDFVDGNRKFHDPNGHGTHVAGIIANQQTGQDGESNGMAPDVDLVGVRVLDEQGFGTYETVIQGIQWVIDHRQEYNIRVMNLSLLAQVNSPYWADPLDRAVMRAWAAGIVVVVAAGNSGPDAMTVGVPGNVPYVITVGAFTDNYTVNDWSDDYITPFSAAGPTLDGFIKPDLVAPGGHIVSTMLPGSYLGREYPEQRITPQYFSLAGTSQAAAVVSGAAALILADDPSLTPNQVKYRLMNTALVWIDMDTTEALYSIFQQGAGRLNAFDAVFSESTDEANAGMDLYADLWNNQHYEGFAYYDEETGTFHLHGDFAEWDGGFWAWDGGYGAWSGGYGAWSGDFGAWMGGYGAWSGDYGAWSGGYGAWSGGYGAWSGGYGAWSGGYGAWSGGYGAWSGNEPWAGSYIAEQSFVEDFLAGVSPDEATSIMSIEFIAEP
jgi:serine protease AprX